MAEPPKTDRRHSGQPVRGSRTGRPIMALLDLLGRRWSLRIVWELRDGPLTARALRAACDEASPTVLNARLAELREARLVDHVAGQGYGLTPLGVEFGQAFMPLYAFAERWAETIPDPTIPRNDATSD